MKSHGSLGSVEVKVDPETKTGKRKISFAEYQKRKKTSVLTTPMSQSDGAVAEIDPVDTETNNIAKASDTAVQTVNWDCRKVSQAATQCAVTTTIIKQTTYPDGRLEVVTSTYFDRPPTKDTCSQTLGVSLRCSQTTIATLKDRRERDTRKTWDRRRQETESEDELSGLEQPKKRCGRDSRQTDGDTTTEEGLASSVERSLGELSD